MIDIVIGCDFGNTIEYKNENGVMRAFPGVWEVMTALTKQVQAVHIVSKVNPRQEEEVRGWLKESNFMAKVGIPAENLHFCANRPDKALIFKCLGVTHVIDDRPEVLAYADPLITKYLFRPRDNEVIQYFNQLVNTKLVYSWSELADWFHIRNGLEMPHV